MKLHIKNMVSLRCIHFVKAELDNLGIAHELVTLGEVEIPEPIPEEKLSLLEDRLNALDLYVIQDKKSLLVEKIKRVVMDMIQKPADDSRPRENYSTVISRQLAHNYTYLANLFSDIEGITVEHFIIAQKIEKVKKLLLEDQLNLTEISYELQYSSVAHLSSQFKKVTGITPSQFRQLRETIQ